MRILMVLTLMIASLLMVALWPDPPPLEPIPVRSGPGVSHVEATTLNHQYQEEFKSRENRRRLQIGAVIVVVTVIVVIGVRLGRRIG